MVRAAHGKYCEKDGGERGVGVRENGIAAVAQYLSALSAAKSGHRDFSLLSLSDIQTDFGSGMGGYNSSEKAITQAKKSFGRGPFSSRPPFLYSVPKVTREGKRKNGKGEGKEGWILVVGRDPEFKGGGKTNER